MSISIRYLRVLRLDNAHDRKMNEDGATRDDNYKENQKYCYRGNQFHCYLPTKISNPTSLPLIPGFRVKGRKFIA
jgi:hypothetical protein